MYLLLTRKDVLLTVVLCAVGIGGLYWAGRSDLPVDYLPLLLTVAIASCAAIGAGIFAPFHRVLLGTILGAVVPPVLVILLRIVQGSSALPEWPL